MGPRRCAACGARTDIMGNGGAYCNKACATAASSNRTTGAARDSTLTLGPSAGSSRRLAHRRPPPPPAAPRRPPPHRCRDRKCACRGGDSAPLTHARLRANIKPDANVTMNKSEALFAEMVKPEFNRREWTLYPQVKIYNPHVPFSIHMVADFIAVFGPPRHGPLAPAEIAAIELDGMSYHNPHADKARDNYALAVHGIETWRSPSAPMRDRRALPYGDLFFDWADNARRIVTIDARRIEAATAVARHSKHIEAVERAAEAEARRTAEITRPLIDHAVAAKRKVAEAEKKRLMLLNENNYTKHRIRALQRDPSTAPPSLRKHIPILSHAQRQVLYRGMHIPAWHKGIDISQPNSGPYGGGLGSRISSILTLMESTAASDIRGT